MKYLANLIYDYKYLCKISIIFLVYYEMDYFFKIPMVEFFQTLAPYFRVFSIKSCKIHI